MNGWNGSVEAKVLRYFGLVADFSGHYGSVSQQDFLFGLRGGGSIKRLRLFAEAMFGAAKVHDSTLSRSDTSFTQAIGAGADFRLMPRLSWRFEADNLTTDFSRKTRQNLRVSTGLVINF